VVHVGEDYTGKKLFVRQSVWRTFTTDPKTAEAARPVPVCETLAELLDSCRQESGYILSTPSGKPINLHNLARRVVMPALKAAGIPWAGWYSRRRGIATLATVVHSAIGAKGLLRHTNVATTQQHYIKDVPAETQRTIEKIDSLFGGISKEYPKDLVQ
jgi:hypothetical protein